MSIRTGSTALVLTVLAGCSAPQASSPPSKPGPMEAPSTVASPTGLATIEACALLTAQEASSLGMRPRGEAEEVRGLRRCDWTTPGGGGVSTSINERLGLSGVNFDDASSVTDVRIGRHQAKRALDGIGPGYCDVDFAIGDTANVSVLALYRNDTARACDVVDRAAVLVESKLP
ncbi:MAG TPA: DUF3558 family protein [Pseudonocardiaceae bacterium]|nr:DUF3558 family protein [Pseudonocardiaceae bacterium]